MTRRIVCIGEPLAEITKDINGMKLAFGGDTLNTAIYLARALQGTEFLVDYLTVLGEDAASEGVMDLMKAEGISSEFIRQTSTHNMGIYAIQNAADGERRFHYWRNTSAARQLFTEPQGAEIDAIDAAHLVYLSGITLAILSAEARVRLLDVLTRFRQNGGLVAFDSNYRPSLWESQKIAQDVTTDFWRITDIGLPTIEDECALFGDEMANEVVARLRQYGVKKGALKQGAFGPLPLSGLELDSPFATATNVVDTTGAGDSFNGGYIANCLLGLSEKDSLVSPHALARQVVGHKGAILPKLSKTTVKRVGSVIDLKPEHAARYIELHGSVWPQVLARLKASNIRNYSIFLKRPEHLMFAYFEYVGLDYEQDMAAIAQDPVTQEWWSVCGPMQEPFETRKEGEWWAEADQVFFLP